MLTNVDSWIFKASICNNNINRSQIKMISDLFSERLVFKPPFNFFVEKKSILKWPVLYKRLVINYLFYIKNIIGCV